jgi:F-type H+-transporting ATPase subunit epsilon
MSGHIPTVAALKTGFVKVKFHDGTEYIAVSTIVNRTIRSDNI